MKIKRFRSLSFKLTLWYIVILGLILTLAGIFLYSAFRESLIDDLDDTLLEIANDTSEFWSERRGVDWLNAMRQAKEKHGNYQPMIQYVHLDEDSKSGIGEIIRSPQIPENSFLLDIEVYERADHADIDDLVYLSLEDENLSSSPVRVFLFPVRGPNLIQVGISFDVIDSALNQLILVLLLAGPLVMLLASLGGIFIIRKALKPVKSLWLTAREISAEDLSLRIDAGNRRDEIGALVATINDMIVRLEKSVKKIRQFSGDVSHELRTPLTVIRGEIEVALRKSRDVAEYQNILASVLEETCRLERIINDLLFLSRAEALKKKEFKQELSLDDLLLQMFEDREPLAREKCLVMGIQGMAPIRIKGDQSLLERLVLNLIENAIRYTSPGGSITLALSKVENYAVLEVTDTGVGIPEKSLPHIFDRFYVVDPSRSKESGGSGLGLSIVKWIAELHGAEIEVDSGEGKGSTFRIRFPLD